MHPKASTLQRLQKVVPSIPLVGAEIIVFRLSLLGKPEAAILFGTVVPAVRQIGRTKLLCFYRNRIQKLIVQLRGRLRLLLADSGDIKRVSILTPQESVMVVVPTLIRKSLKST